MRVCLRQESYLPVGRLGAGPGLMTMGSIPVCQAHGGPEQSKASQTQRVMCQHTHTNTHTPHNVMSQL